MTRAMAIAICAMVLVLPATAQNGKGQKGKGGGPTSVLPVVDSISPDTTEAGSGTFIMTVTGQNFTTGSVVRWNGSNISTGYVSDTQLNATVSSAYTVSTGTASISVYTSGRKGGESNTLNFTITEPTTITTTKRHIWRHIRNLQFIGKLAGPSKNLTHTFNFRNTI